MKKLHRIMLVMTGCFAAALLAAAQHWFAAWFLAGFAYGALFVETLAAEFTERR